MTRLLFLACVSCCSMAAADDACTLEETQKLSTVTGRFRFGSSDISLTLPHVLYRSAASVVYLQVRGDVPGGLRMDSGGEAIDVSDGAGLPLSPRRGTRLTFTVSDRSGQRLCEWATHVGTSKSEPPLAYQGFTDPGAARFGRGLQIQRFRNAGDPILLHVGGVLARDPGEPYIDGVSARVLSRNAHQIVLQDPRPAAGLRKVEARGYSIALLFVELHVAMDGPKTGRAKLAIHIGGRDPTSPSAFPKRRLSLYNFAPENVELLCGKRGADPRAIDLAVQKGELVGSCKVRMLKPGSVSFDAAYTEIRTGKRRLF